MDFRVYTSVIIKYTENVAFYISLSPFFVCVTTHVDLNRCGNKTTWGNCHLIFLRLYISANIRRKTAYIIIADLYFARYLDSVNASVCASTYPKADIQSIRTRFVDTFQNHAAILRRKKSCFCLDSERLQSNLTSKHVISLR